MAITRAEGYRRGIGKERAALDVFEDFMGSTLEITDYRFVTDKDENWRKGDYQLPNGKYIEVKGQPINPAKYDKNYVELGEITDKLHHAGGFRMLKELLNLPNLHNKDLKNKAKNTRGPIGEPPCFSLSLASLANNTAYAYVNSDLEIIYLYSSTTLKKYIVDSINSSMPLLQGAGNANEVGVGVLINLPIAIWRKVDGVWLYEGTGSEDTIIRSINA